MKKLSLLISIAMLFLAWQALPAFALDATFTVSATLDPATGVTITASSVVKGPPIVFTKLTGTSLSFDPLTFDPLNSIWLPNHFFAIDVAPSGGGGSVSTAVTYTEGNNPNSATTGHGLGYKSTATFVKVSGTPASEAVLTSISGGKMRLIDLHAQPIASSLVAGGYLRIYVGIVAKDPAAVPLDPANSEPFTNADAAGPYNGQLLVSATQV
jgi:hypothetical protein